MSCRGCSLGPVVTMGLCQECLDHACGPVEFQESDDGTKKCKRCMKWYPLIVRSSGMCVPCDQEARKAVKKADSEESYDDTKKCKQCKNWYPLIIRSSGLCVKCDLAQQSITEFKKADDGKPRPDLIPVELLVEMGKVMKHGADKYGADNWKNCEDPKRYEAAIARHWLAYLSGEELDPDSGLSHLAHCACSLGMLFGVIVENAKGKSKL